MGEFYSPGAHQVHRRFMTRRYETTLNGRKTPVQDHFRMSTSTEPKWLIRSHTVEVGRSRLPSPTLPVLFRRSLRKPRPSRTTLEGWERTRLVSADRWSWSLLVRVQMSPTPTWPSGCPDRWPSGSRRSRCYGGECSEVATMQLDPDFREFVESFNDHDVRYLVVGAFAR